MICSMTNTLGGLTQCEQADIVGMICSKFIQKTSWSPLFLAALLILLDP